jgi:hypothetical protein
MLRRPTKLILLLVFLAFAGVAFYYIAQLRMQTPPHITVTQVEWQPPDAPNAYLKINYEMKNTAFFPVRVHVVSMVGSSGTFGDDMELPGGDDLVLKPQQVYKGNVRLPKDNPPTHVVSRIVWEPAVKKRIWPFLRWMIDIEQRFFATNPVDPFAPPTRFYEIIQPHNSSSERMRIELPLDDSPSPNP